MPRQYRGRIRRTKPNLNDVTERMRKEVFRLYDNTQAISMLPSKTPDQARLFGEILNLVTTDDLEGTINDTKTVFHEVQCHKAYMALSNLLLMPFAQENNLPTKIEYIHADPHTNQSNVKKRVQISLQLLLFARVYQELEERRRANPQEDLQALTGWVNLTTKILKERAEPYGLLTQLPEYKPRLLPAIFSIVSAYFLSKSYFTYSDPKALAKSDAASWIIQFSLIAMSTGAAYITRQHTLGTIIGKAITLFPAARSVISPSICAFMLARYATNAGPVAQFAAGALVTTCSAAYQLFFKPNEDGDVNAQEAVAAARST